MFTQVIQRNLRLAGSAASVYKNLRNRKERHYLFKHMPRLAETSPGVFAVPARDLQETGSNAICCTKG
jgi:hypothetical protein